MAVKKKYDRNVLGRGLDNIGGSKGLGLDALIDTHDVASPRLKAVVVSMLSSIPPV